LRSRCWAVHHFRDVVAAVSRAGGLACWAPPAHSLRSIEQELTWIDDSLRRQAYGLTC